MPEITHADSIPVSMRSHEAARLWRIARAAEAAHAAWERWLEEETLLPSDELCAAMGELCDATRGGGPR